MRRCRRSAHRFSPDERLQGLVLAVANILAPLPEKTLHSITSFVRRPIAKSTKSPKDDSALDQPPANWKGKSSTRSAILWPAPTVVFPNRRHAWCAFLAPFDPVVWDRLRFEHLWGWPYRFEAYYTPSAKRVRGYYAMPLLLVRSGNRVGKRRDRRKQGHRGGRFLSGSGLRIANSNRNWKLRLPGCRRFLIAREGRHEPRRAGVRICPAERSSDVFAAAPDLSSFARLGR